MHEFLELIPWSAPIGHPRDMISHQVSETLQSTDDIPTKLRKEAQNTHPALKSRQKNGRPVAISDDQVFHFYLKQITEHHQVIDRGKGIPSLPLADSLRADGKERT